MPHRQLQHAAAALQRERGPAGVAEGGNEIDKARAVLFHEPLQRIGLHAVGIGRGADDLRAVEAKALNGGQKSRAFNDDFAARLGQCFAHQVQRLLAAGGDDELLCPHTGAVRLHERGQLLAQGHEPFRRAVLQRLRSLLRQRLAGGFFDVRHIKQGTVGKAARKTDDAGPAQQLEHFADGGGFHMAQTLGEGVGGGWLHG